MQTLRTILFFPPNLPQSTQKVRKTPSPHNSPIPNPPSSSKILMDLQTLAYYLFILLPAFYIGLTLAFSALSALSLYTPSSTFYGRTLAAYGTLCLCALYGVAASLTLRLLGLHRLSQFATARAFKWSMRYTTDVRFEIISGGEHLDGTRPAVLIGNHQSALDILLLGTIWPRYCSVTAKSSLKYLPFLGWFMALSGTIFIDRANRDSAIQAFDRAAEEMRRARQSVFIFPEGTRSNASGPFLRGFKKGAFHLAVRAQVPIVPVVCANYWGVLSIEERRFRAGRIPVIVLEPVETKGLKTEDVDRLTEEMRERMLRELVLLSESPAGLKAMQAQPGIEEESKVAAEQRASEKERRGKESAAASGVER